MIGVLFGTAMYVGLVLGGGPAAVAPAVQALDATDLSQEVVTRGDAYWHLARAFYVVARHHQASEALSDIRRALELEPGSADLKAEAAGLLALLGQRSEAETVARAALEIDDAQPRALRVLAELVIGRAMSASDPEASEIGMGEAIELFERLTVTDESEPDDLLILARLQTDAGRYADAADTARRLADQRPGDPEVLDVLVRALIRAEHVEAALEAMVDFLSRNSGPIGALDLERTSDWIRRLVDQEDVWGLLAERGGAVVEAHPEVAGFRALYGEALLRAERNVEAIEQLERAVALAEGDPAELQFFLSTAYGSTGRLADAAELSAELLVKFPRHAGLLNLLGETQALRGQVDEAVATLSRAIEAFGSDLAARDRRDGLRLRAASLLIGDERFAEARSILDAIEVPADPQAIEVRAVLGLREGNDKDARRSIRALREVGGTSIAVADMLEAEALAREGRDAKARETFELSATTLGNQVLARGAELFRDLGKADQGEAMLRGWVARESDSSRARFRLGAFLERTSSFDAAARELRRATELDPEDAEVLNYLGYSLADRKLELDEALRLIERALEIDPWNAAYLDSLGWVYYRMGKFADARIPLERAAREYPRDPTILDHLGDVYAGLEEPQRALESWQRARDLADGEVAQEIAEKISAWADRADLEAVRE